MGIYASKIEKRFQDLPEIENVLQKYDNVTYHIQFFMVPRNIQFDYMHERGVINSDYYQQINAENHSPEDIELIKKANSEALLNLDKKLLQRAVIIAESGVTNTISIESLSMVTHPPVSAEQFGATTVEMDLKLSELNSSSLTNKIALASYLCGYESYCYQQYFINIWFTGYDPRTGKPIDKIPLGENGIKQCLYQVTMGDVKTSSESNKTTYNIKLYPSFYSSLSKDVNIVSNIGELELSADKSFSSFVQVLQDKVNEKLRAQYGIQIMNHIYAGYDPLEIIVATALTNKVGIVRQKTLKGGVSSAYEYDDSEDQIFVSSEAYNNMSEEEQQIIDKGSNQGRATKIVRGLSDGFKRLIGSYDVEITPEKEDTIISILQKMMTHYALVMDGEILTINYDNMYVGNFKGVNYFKHIITIGKAKAPGLKDIQENVIGKDYDNLYSAMPSLFQDRYLDELLGYNLLQKKYYWLHNGKNINVLSVKTEDDNMWYLNLGLTDLYAVTENLPKTNYNPEKSEEINVYRSRLTQPSAQGEVLKDAKLYYIDDIYNYFINKNNTNPMSVSSWHKIAESNSSLNELPASSAVVHNDKNAESLDSNAKAILENEIRYKLGMENLFQVTNQKIKLDLDIIGDPYWMFFGDTTNNSAQHNLVLPHLLLFQRSFMVADGMDNYEEDKLMEYNSLYTVIKIVSTFEGGTFKQRISGQVATPFIQSSKFEESANYMNSLTLGQRRAVYTYQKNNGEIIHQ